MPHEYKSALAQAAGQAISTRPPSSLPFPADTSSSSISPERSVHIRIAPMKTKLTSSSGEERQHTTGMNVPRTTPKQPPLVLEPTYRLFPQPDLREEKQQRRSSSTTDLRNESELQEEHPRPTRREPQTQARSHPHHPTHGLKLQLQQTSASNSRSTRLQGASTKTVHERQTTKSEPMRVSFNEQPTSRKQSNEASTTVTGDYRPFYPALQDTARSEKRDTMTTRQFDRHCLDLIKSHGVRKLLKSSTKEPTLPPSSLPFRLNTAIEPFRNLCICDPKIAGQPIKLKSKYFALGPRGLKVSACGFINLPLNSSRQLRPFLGIYHRPHPDKSPVYVLEYAAGLMSQESSSTEPIYVLACQIDITEFIKKLTYRMLAAKFQAEAYAERQATREAKEEAEHHKRGSIEIRHRDSAIMIDTTRNLSNLNLAGKAADQYKGGLIRAVRIEQALKIIDDDEASSPINELEIDDFSAPPKDRNPLSEAVTPELQSLLSTILRQYKDCFVLSPTSSLDGIFQAQSSSHWQISYTSYDVHAARADLRVALSKTKQEVLASLGAQLAGYRDIREMIRWGARGERKMLCAVPMIRDRGLGASCWLCFLLDAT